MTNRRTQPFVEFIERFDAAGVASATLVCQQLPVGHSCRIRRREDGLYVRRTKANGKGSIRYTIHLTLEDAFADARKWAIRKVAEARREAAKSCS